MNERLRKLAEAGQSVWIDSLSRDDIENGNSHSTLYDEQLQKLSRREDDPKEIFLGLAKKDIQDACDLLMPVFERTNHLDGYVSLEVSPHPGDRRGGDAPAQTGRPPEPDGEDTGDAPGPSGDRGHDRHRQLYQHHPHILFAAL